MIWIALGIMLLILLSTPILEYGLVVTLFIVAVISDKIPNRKDETD